MRKVVQEKRNKRLAEQAAEAEQASVKCVEPRSEDGVKRGKWAEPQGLPKLAQQTASDVSIGGGERLYLKIS